MNKLSTSKREGNDKKNKRRNRRTSEKDDLCSVYDV